MPDSHLASWWNTHLEKKDISLYPNSCAAENHSITYTCLIQDDRSAKRTFCRFHVWFSSSNQTWYASHVLSPLPPSPFTKGRPPIRSNGIEKVLLFQWGYLKIIRSLFHAHTQTDTQQKKFRKKVLQYIKYSLDHLMSFDLDLINACTIWSVIHTVRQQGSWFMAMKLIIHLRLHGW